MCVWMCAGSGLLNDEAAAAAVSHTQPEKMGVGWSAAAVAAAAVVVAGATMGRGEGKPPFSSLLFSLLRAHSQSPLVIKRETEAEAAGWRMGRVMVEEPKKKKKKAVAAAVAAVGGSCSLRRRRRLRHTSTGGREKEREGKRGRDAAFYTK